MKKIAVPMLIVGVLSMITAYLYSYGNGGVFQMVEHAFRDALRTKSVEEQIPDDRIKIIAIDEASLEQLGPFPWPRAVYADLVGDLMQAGARAVALDLLLIDPSEEVEDDRALSEQLSKYAHIYLPVQVTLRSLQPDGQSLVVERVDRPAPSIQIDPGQLGHVNVLPDSDGVIRNMSLGLPDEQGMMLPSLDILMANRLLPKDQQIRWDPNDNGWYQGRERIPTDDRHQVAIDFFSSPYGYGEEAMNGYDRQSFCDVLSGIVDPAYYKDTIVLIGPYATSLSDRHMTPLSRSMTLYGVEIHANMIQSLMEGRFYKEAPFGWSVFALITGISAAAWCAYRIRGVRGALCGLSMVVGYTLIWVGIYSIGAVFIPYLTEVIGMSAAYILVIAYRSREDRRARQQVEELFGRYVSPSVVTELLQSNVPIRAGGTKCDITVMFIDIRGFTPLSERLEPERTIQVLNQYLHLCAETIFQHHGTLDKFIGDGVMAIFGAPHILDRHAEHAARAAMELQHRSEDLYRKLSAELDVSVRFGIGIQSGEAVVGNVGSETLRLDYTAIGDTVNVAARLESQAKPGQVLVGEEANRRIQDAFETHSIGPLRLKGKAEAVMVYELISK